MNKQLMYWAEALIWTGVVMMLGTYMPDPTLQTFRWVAALGAGSMLWAYGVMFTPINNVAQRYGSAMD